MSKSMIPSKSKDLLKSLQDSHAELTDKVEALYASLNIHESYPALKGVSLDFVRTLLMARDLKINIRKRAIGSFFEWDRLDQAVGGRHQALGTKLHQHTRKSIAKRKPALMNAIKKFNLYCATLEELYNPISNIPLPLPLPTKLADLRDNSSLMEDVWIIPSKTTPQPWLEDVDVRMGIRAMLKADRCLEERRRLGREADNLCRWFGRELSAIELALRTNSCMLTFSPGITNNGLTTVASMAVPLSQHRDRLLHLKTRWTNSMASSVCFDAHVNSAKELASHISGNESPFQVTWIEESIATVNFTDNELIHPAPKHLLDTDSNELEDVDVSELMDMTGDILSAEFEGNVISDLVDLTSAGNTDIITGQQDTQDMVVDQDSTELMWELPVFFSFNFPHCSIDMLLAILKR